MLKTYYEKLALSVAQYTASEILVDNVERYYHEAAAMNINTNKNEFTTAGNNSALLESVNQRIDAIAKAHQTDYLCIIAYVVGGEPLYISGAGSGVAGYTSGEVFVDFTKSQLAAAEGDVPGYLICGSKIEEYAPQSDNNGDRGGVSGADDDYMVVSVYAGFLKRAVYSSRLKYTALITAIFTVVTVFASTYVVLRINRTVTAPLSRLAEVTSRYIQGTENKRSSRELYSLSFKNNTDVSSLHSVILKLTSDIDDKLRSLKIAKWESKHDHLTMLGNVKMLEERKENEYQRLKSVLVVFIDLNGIKYINDLYGHAAGNNVLKRLAEELRKLSDERTHIYRIGGDEFLIIVCDADEERDKTRIIDWYSSIAA